MRDVFSAAITEVCDSWTKEAQQRRARTPNDDGAALLESCASELRSRIEQVERETAYLTVAQYAAEWGPVNEATVRRLCAANLIEGAIKGPDNEWRIPRNAKRRKVAS